MLVVLAAVAKVEMLLTEWLELQILEVVAVERKNNHHKVQVQVVQV